MMHLEAAFIISLQGYSYNLMHIIQCALEGLARDDISNDLGVTCGDLESSLGRT